MAIRRMAHYTAPLPLPLDCRTELQLVLGDIRPAGTRTLDDTNRASRSLFGAVCHRWGQYNERIKQQPFELAFVGMGALDDPLQDTDTYVSQGAFNRPNRQKAHLHSIALLYVDLDFRKATAFPNGMYDTPRLEEIIARVLAHLDQRNLPRPSYLIASGRGLHAKWLVEPLPPAALSRWQACMSTLCRELRPYGADENAKDVSRILRPIGSRNSRSRTLVREAWRNADAAGGIRVYGFDELADCILPLSREECRKRRQAKQERKAERRRARKRKADTADSAREVAKARAIERSKQLWKVRLRDIEQLFEMRAYDRCGGIPDGMRVTAMVILAVALTHLVHPANVLAHLHAYRDRWLRRWSDEKVRQSVATVLRVASEGRRLRYSNSTLIELLCITRAERSQLRSIGLDLDAEQRKERKRAVEAAKRRDAGAVPRQVSAAKRDWCSRQVLTMRQAGVPWKQICKELDISRATANRLHAQASSAAVPAGNRQGKEVRPATAPETSKRRSLHRADSPIQLPCSPQLLLPLTQTSMDLPPSCSQTSTRSKDCACITSCAA